MISAAEKLPAPVLELSGIHKQFPGVKALSDVGLRLYPGEVHTLMGQNGAGKSTLIKVLTGVYAPDSGRIVLDGREIRPSSTLEAQNLGISTVYQEVNLCPNLSVAENIFIGRYPRRWGSIDWAAMQRQAVTLLRQLQVEIDVTAPLSRYPLAIQQMVAISRALSVSARVLILDEPTSSLDDSEVQLLFSVLRGLREQGMAILFVTHFLEQTYAISDRITVMRNGEREGEYACSELSRLALVNKMVGATVDASAAAAGHRFALRRTARPVRPARLRPDRDGAFAVRRRQGRQRQHQHRRACAQLQFAARRHRGRHRLLLGGPQARRRDPRIVGARKRHPRAAGQARHVARDSVQTAAGAGQGLRQMAGREDTEYRNQHRLPVRRQPAESAAGALAGDLARHADPRRTDARHRRARQTGNHGLCDRAVPQGHGDIVYLIGAAGGAEVQRPHRRHA